MNSGPKEQVQQFFREHPETTTAELAARFGVCRETALRYLNSAGLKPPRRQYERQFDWDEVRRLYAEGFRKSEIAQMVGASNRTVGMILNGRGWRGERPSCENCGVQVDIGSVCCSHCSQLKKIKVNDEGQLWCSDCKTWKDVENFSRSSRSARGRNNICRPCDHGRKRNYRARMKAAA